MSGYYDRQGQPLDLHAWGRKLDDNDYRQVARTEISEVDDAPYVSTVWLGLDHQWGDGPPLIFETMVFGGAYNEHLWRYTTEEQALAGHDQIVADIREGRDPYAE